MALLMCHIHYTLTQPETLGLIDNTLPNKKTLGLINNTFTNKNLKTNVMDAHCNLIVIFNGKQVRPASSMLTRIEVQQTIGQHTH